MLLTDHRVEAVDEAVARMATGCFRRRCQWQQRVETKTSPHVVGVGTETKGEVAAVVVAVGGQIQRLLAKYVWSIGLGWPSALTLASGLSNVIHDPAQQCLLAIAFRPELRPRMMKHMLLRCVFR